MTLFLELGFYFPLKALITHQRRQCFWVFFLDLFFFACQSQVLIIIEKHDLKKKKVEVLTWTVFTLLYISKTTTRTEKVKEVN